VGQRVSGQYTYLVLQCLLTLCFTFAVYVLFQVMFTTLIIPFILNLYMSLPNWATSGVHIVVLKESALLLLYCNCLKLFLCW
jgi:hypothetical protein